MKTTNFNRHIKLFYIVECLLAASFATFTQADDKCTAVVESVNDAGYGEVVLAVLCR